MTPPVEFYEAQGHRIAFIGHNRHLSATPLVFLHGLTASVRFWEAAMYPYVRENHPWYSISLPLHYPSTFPDGLTQDSIDEYLFSDLLDAGIKKLAAGRPVILIGYSLGGFAALNYAAKRPGRVKGVVSIGGFITGRAKGLEQMLIRLSQGRFIRKALFHLGWRVMRSHPFFLRLAVKQYAYDDRALSAFPALQPTLDNIFPDLQCHDAEAMRLLFHYLLNMNVADEIRRITMPVLVFAGERDPIIPFRHQEKYARALPQARFHPLPGTGHVPFAERPEEFRRVLIGWLREMEEA